MESYLWPSGIPFRWDVFSQIIAPSQLNGTNAGILVTVVCMCTQRHNNAFKMPSTSTLNQPKSVESVKENEKKGRKKAVRWRMIDDD